MPSLSQISFSFVNYFLFVGYRAFITMVNVSTFFHAFFKISHTLLCPLLSGYRSGGPVRSIANLVDHLADEFDVRIVTLNRDASACQPYPLVDINAWNTVGKARVFYCAPNLFTYIYFLRIILTSQYDILYLNSFFDIRFSLLPLILRRIGLVPRKPCVIAPRGQFSAGALFFKPRGKRLYIIGSKIFRIFGGLFWQASCSSEKSDISRELGPIAKNIKVVPNLTPISIDPVKTDIRSPGCLRLVFISRITPKKNLDFLLRSLIYVSGNVILSIYGPYEDAEYATLPSLDFPIACKCQSFTFGLFRKSRYATFLLKMTCLFSLRLVRTLDMSFMNRYRLERRFLLAIPPRGFQTLIAVFKLLNSTHHFGSPP